MATPRLGNLLDWFRGKSNCYAWARRKQREEGGYVAYHWTEGGPRFYYCTGLINAQYRRPLHRYRIPWNILWHRGRVERMVDPPQSGEVK